MMRPCLRGVARYQGWKKKNRIEKTNCMGLGTGEVKQGFDDPALAVDERVEGVSHLT